MGEIMQEAYEEVYRIVKKIPKGKVMTYGRIANELRSKNIEYRITARMVGRALHLNPDPTKIPCHRVINNKGKIAVNFAFGGDNEHRKRLLAEGVEFKNAMHVNLKRCLI